MKLGYCRISTHDQNLNLQKDALEKEGCEKIFEDIVSGAKTERLGLNDLLSHIRKGDTLVVWRLDRLGRGLKHLIELINKLEEQGIAFKSITENIDTSTSGGKLIFHIFGSLAEFERNIIRERTRAGLNSARARGRTGGRPKTATSNEKSKMAKALYNDKSNNVEDICRTLGVSRSSFYRMVKIKG